MIYEYFCEKCKTTIEEVRKIEDRDDDMFCPECNHLMVRVFAASTSGQVCDFMYDTMHLTGKPGYCHGYKELQRIAEANGKVLSTKHDIVMPGQTDPSERAKKKGFVCFF